MFQYILKSLETFLSQKFFYNDVQIHIEHTQQLTNNKRKFMSNSDLYNILN